MRRARGAVVVLTDGLRPRRAGGVTEIEIAPGARTTLTGLEPRDSPVLAGEQYDVDPAEPPR